MRLKLVRGDTKIDFFQWEKLTFGLSASAVVASIILFFVMGLNFGIDFRGGSMIMADTPEVVEVSTYRDILGGLEIGDTSVTEISDPAAELTGTAHNSVMIRIEQVGDDAAIQNDAIVAVKDALTAALPGISFLSTEASVRKFPAS